MMHLLRVRVAVVVGISGLMLASTTLAAQPTGLDRFVGEWSGPLVTPSLRGTVTHRLSRSADALVIQTTVSARGTTLHGSAERIQLRADTLTFHVDLGGSNIEWTAILRENGLVGTVRVRQQMDVVADGVWEATRPASNIPAVVGAAALLDAAWTMIDRGYANFGDRAIDWDTVRRVFASRLTASASDSVTFSVITEMLGLLNDEHVGLRSDTRRFTAGRRAETPEDSALHAIIARRYVRTPFAAHAQGTIRAGWLADSVAYMHLAEFAAPRLVGPALDSILEQVVHARGLVIDLRDNRGGSDVSGQRLLRRIADQRRLYMSSRARALRAHDSFLPPQEWFMQPSDEQGFSGPVIVLTNRRTVSAAENFLLGARELPHVSIVGDVTAGAFSDVTRETLPNGWVLSFPLNAITDARGRSWEGVGIAPDYRRTNTPAERASSRDTPLELALDLLANRPRP